MANKKRLLMIENPDTKAEVDFLGLGYNVTLEVVNGKVEICVKKFDKSDGYQWKEEFVTVNL